MRNFEEKFTIEQFRNYIKSQDSLGDVMYNLTSANIHKANVKEIVFRTDIIGDDFEVDDKIGVIASMEKYLDDIRSWFDFDEWDECQGEENIYFEYEGHQFKFSFKYGDCIEATHEHRIMELIPIITALCN